MTELTVIIPTHNMNETVERAIGSALDQDIDVEIIVIDDGSLHPFVLSKDLLCEKVTLLRHEERQGAAAARNTAIQAAKTPWLCFLDADDFLLPQTLGCRLNFGKRICGRGADTAKSIFACAWTEFDGEGKPKHVRQPLPTRSEDDFFTGCWWSPGSAMLAHASLFTQTGLHYDASLNRLEDFDLAIRMGASGCALYSQSINGVAIRPSNKVAYAQVCKASMQIVEKHATTFGISRKRANAIRAYLDLELFKFAWLQGDFAMAAIHVVRSYLRKPRIRRHFSPGWRISALTDQDTSALSTHASEIR